MSTDANIQTVTGSTGQVSYGATPAQPAVRVVTPNSNSSASAVSSARQGQAGGNLLPSGRANVSEGRGEGAGQLKSDDVSQAMQALADYAQNVQRQLQFSIDEDTGRTIIKVVDSETNEVIRQIPSEEIMNLARALHKFSEDKGRIFQTTV
jgi:flagellar protein FlaG